uniref:Uncharacterized protein n=1 Tax=Eptatretus burgeri TaxID=7764 RepID=A0A8C4R7S5_EPTBU
MFPLCRTWQCWPRRGDTSLLPLTNKRRKWTPHVLVPTVVCVLFPLSVPAQTSTTAACGSSPPCLFPLPYPSCGVPRGPTILPCGRFGNPILQPVCYNTSHAWKMNNVQPLRRQFV